MDKDSVAWRRHPRTKSKYAQIHQMMLKEKHTKEGVLNGPIPLAAWYTACISHSGLVGDSFSQTNRKSTNIFVLADGHPTPATTITLLEDNIQEPVRTVNMVPDLANQSLLSGGKFAESGFISVCVGK